MVAEKGTHEAGGPSVYQCHETFQPIPTTIENQGEMRSSAVRRSFSTHGKLGELACRPCRFLFTILVRRMRRPRPAKPEHAAMVSSCTGKKSRHAHVAPERRGRETRSPNSFCASCVRSRKTLATGSRCVGLQKCGIIHPKL